MWLWNTAGRLASAAAVAARQIEIRIAAKNFKVESFRTGTLHRIEERLGRVRSGGEAIEGTVLFSRATGITSPNCTKSVCR
jgi:hypothetical protein